MLSNPYIETLIALIFIYALLSTLVSILNEWFNHFISSRGVFLKQVINKMLFDPINQSYGYLLYRHPMIDKLRKDNKSLPHYISAEAFAIATIETIAEDAVKDSITQENGIFKLIEGPREKDTAKRFATAVENMGHSDLKKLLRYFLERSYNATTEKYDIEILKKEIAGWFNEHMDRASGWYKTKQRPRLILLGFIIAIAMNVDSIHLTRVLMTNPELRTKFVTEAEKSADVFARATDSSVDAKIRTVVDSFMVHADKDTSASRMQYLNRAVTQLKMLSDSTQQAAFDKSMRMTDQMAKMGLPFGWQDDAAPVSWLNKVEVTNLNSARNTDNYFSKRNKFSGWSLLVYLLGIIITAISLSFGAPFWFDVLLKFVNIRRAGAKPADNNTSSNKK